jgi:hypothetical protein
MLHRRVIAVNALVEKNVEFLEVKHKVTTWLRTVKLNIK